MCSQQNSKIMYILINNLGGFNLAHFEYSEMGKNEGGGIKIKQSFPKLLDPSTVCNFKFTHFKSLNIVAPTPSD